MRTLLILCAAAAAVFLGADAWAGKGNGHGGGGGDPPPGGTIYFQDAPSYAIGSIAPDGSGETTYSGVDVDAWVATYALHGGRRWFLFRRPVAGTNPDTFGKVALFAVAEDGQEVQLTNGDIRVFDSAWGRDDSFLSFVGIEWYGSGSTDANSHIFRAAVDWSSGAPALAAAPASVVTGGIYGTDNLQPDFSQPDWSPDGDEVVYRREVQDSSPAPLDVTVVGGATRSLGVDGHDPEWAPDGSRIAFDAYQSPGPRALFTIRPDGSDLVQLSNPGGASVHWRAHWSPDGTYLAFTNTHSKKGASVALIPATGGSISGVRNDATAFAWR